jgi:choice-of-anchor C domain-containing protein
MSRPTTRVASWLLVLALGTWAVSPARANLLTNGSFEAGPAPGEAVQLSAGSTAITGWIVTGTNIDYCGTRWAAASGSSSVALNGSDAGGIAQTFATVTGGQYGVRFYLSGDPFSTPAVKQVRVTAADQSADFSDDITGIWPWAMAWSPKNWSFTASAMNTTLEFHSLMGGDTGPAIDSVSVELISSATTGVGSNGTQTLGLAPFAPNPTHDGGRTQFTITRAMPVRLSVFDLAGREIAVLADGVFQPGHYSAAWNGRTASGRSPSGLYLLQLSARGQRLTQRLVVTREGAPRTTEEPWRLAASRATRRPSR